jgi:predicted nuclease with RNAse H fold
MLSAMTRWIGVDVGGRRKGFDVAVVDERRLLRLAGRLGCDEVVALVAEKRPAVVAIDSPRRCAPDGDRSREGERLLAKTVCGIRWTPDAATVRASGYYGWIVEGLALYAALEQYKPDLIEVFPTASWTRWYGARAGKRRAAWSRDALVTLDIEGVPRRTNQDQRDAIAAALTARQFGQSQGRTSERFGDIVVPAVAPSPTATP